MINCTKALSTKQVWQTFEQTLGKGSDPPHYVLHHNKTQKQNNLHIFIKETKHIQASNVQISQITYTFVNKV